jgi:putative flippase GtrA
MNYREFLRFCMVGGVSALLSLLLLFILTDILKFHYLVSFILGFFIVNSISYMASRHFTFGQSRFDVAEGAARYCAISLFSLGLNTLVLRFLVSTLSMNYLAAALLLTFANAPLNYFLHRRLSFGLTGTTKRPKAAK